MKSFKFNISTYRFRLYFGRVSMTNYRWAYLKMSVFPFNMIIELFIFGKTVTQNFFLKTADFDVFEAHSRLTLHHFLRLKFDLGTNAAFITPCCLENIN